MFYKSNIGFFAEVKEYLMHHRSAKDYGLRFPTWFTVCRQLTRVVTWAMWRAYPARTMQLENTIISVAPDTVVCTGRRQPNGGGSGLTVATEPFS